MIEELLGLTPTFGPDGEAELAKLPPATREQVRAAAKRLSPLNVAVHLLTEDEVLLGVADVKLMERSHGSQFKFPPFEINVRAPGKAHKVRLVTKHGTMDCDVDLGNTNDVAIGQVVVIGALTLSMS